MTLLPSSLTTTDLIRMTDSYYSYKYQIEDDSTALNYEDLLDMLESLKKLLEHINHQDKIIADYSRKVKPYLGGGGEANISRREVSKRVMFSRHARPRVFKSLKKPEI
jgi:hypothetical protein